MVKMDLPNSKSQGTSETTASDSRRTAFTSAITALTTFSEEEDLQGSAYDSAKTFASSVLVPLMKAADLLSDAIKDATVQLPSDYTTQVCGESLDSETLQNQINAYTSSINSLEQSIQTANAQTSPDQNLINRMTAQQIKQKVSRKLLENKLEKLMAFDADSPNIFNRVPDLQAAFQAGLTQVTDTFATSTGGSFPIPADLTWTQTVQTAWDLRQSGVSGDIAVYNKASLDARREEIKNGGGSRLDKTDQLTKAYEDYLYFENKEAFDK